MLILVSTCFLLLNAPSHVCSIAMKIYASKDVVLTNDYHRKSLNTINVSNETLSTRIESSNFISTINTTAQISQPSINETCPEIFYTVLIVCNHISYLSYSINFFLYSLCGAKFRRELVKYFSRHRKYRRQTKIM